MKGQRLILNDEGIIGVPATTFIELEDQLWGRQHISLTLGDNEIIMPNHPYEVLEFDFEIKYQYQGDQKYGGGWVTQKDLETHNMIKSIFPEWIYRQVAVVKLLTI